MRILFCDDNPEIVLELQKYVSSFFRELGGPVPELIAYTSGDAVVSDNPKVDIAFLDVEMPGISGIHVGERLKARNPQIKVFIITAYPNYLDEAMHYQVFRYISKPIDRDRLFRNLRDAVKQYNASSRKFPIVTQHGVVLCRAEDIVCVEAALRRVTVVTTEEILISTENMEYWKNTLTLPCFYASHRSFIVNMRFVSAITSDSILLKYGNKQKYAYLSRRRYSDFKHTFLQYLEAMK